MTKVAVFFLGLMLSGSAQAVGPTVESIPQFLQVTPDLYRGGTPGPDGIAYLAQIGVKTILDMETTDSEISLELATAAPLNIRVISKQLPPLLVRPTDTRMDQIIDILKDRSNYPLFVHCKHGQDRTGVAIGLFRVYVQGWSPTDAYNEMVALNFHPTSEIGLRCYFEEKTGMPVSSVCAFIPSYDPD